MGVLRGQRDMGAHLISPEQDHSELELCLLQLGTLGTGFDSRPGNLRNASRAGKCSGSRAKKVAAASGLASTPRIYSGEECSKEQIWASAGESQCGKPLRSGSALLPGGGEAG